MEKLSLLGARILRLLRLYRVSLVFAGVALWRFVRPRRGSTVGRHGSTMQILVVRLDAIGDLVMSTLVFRELKQYFPESTITVVVQAQNKVILETNPYVDCIFSPKRIGKSRLFRDFRENLSVLKLYWAHFRDKHVDLVVNPRLDGDLYGADVLLKLVDCAKTYKYAETSKKGVASKINELAFNKAVNLPRPQPRHEVLNNRAMMEAVTGAVCTARPEMFLTAEDLASNKELFESIAPDAAVICISFGAQAMRRVWPIERWAEVIRILSLERLVFVLILCTKSEAATGSQLQSMLPVPSHIMTGATLRQLAAAIQSSDLFMGPDSGLAHLAAAVSCPSVIVSPHPVNGDLDHGNSPVRFRPFSNHATVVQPQRGIAPCDSGCDAIVPHCILQVLPSQVAKAALEMLDVERDRDSRPSLRRTLDTSRSLQR